MTLSSWRVARISRERLHDLLPRMVDGTHADFGRGSGRRVYTERSRWLQLAQRRSVLPRHCRSPVGHLLNWRMLAMTEPVSKEQYACGECGKPIKTGCYCAECAKGEQPPSNPLPCPFCGRNDLLAVEPGEHPGVLQVVCRHCGARGPTRHDRNEAKLRWNARAADETPARPTWKDCTFGDAADKSTDVPHD
jgi:Lar family restriction alleviation protein